MTIVEQTPIQALQNQIEFFERLIKKIETKDGIYIETPEQQKKIDAFIPTIYEKIVEYQKAINVLRSIN